MAAPKELGQGMTRLSELFGELLGDIHRSFEVLERDKSDQTFRRNAVRTVFSAIEGMLSIIRHEILREVRRSEQIPDLVTPKEMEMLSERKVRSGVGISFYPSLSDRVKRYFLIAARVFGLVDFSFDTSGSEFESFEVARNTRDRLTHPRDFYDIQITDAEMRHLVVSMLWIREALLNIFRLKIWKARSELPEWALPGWDELFEMPAPRIELCRAEQRVAADRCLEDATPAEREC